MTDRDSRLVDETDDVVARATREANYRARQSVLRALYDITTSSLVSGLLQKPENRPIIDLARALSDLIDENVLIVEGSSQAELFQTRIVDTGCYDRGALFVSPDFGEELARRPDSVRAEMLYKMASAVLVDGNIPQVGGFKSMGEVRSVIGAFVRAFPSDAILTDEQRLMR